MEEVKEFSYFLIKKEQEAIDAGNKKEELEKYNALATEIKSYMIDVTVGFGLPILTNSKPAFLYRDNPPYPNPRYLFKISEYENDNYGNIWACYVSVPNPSSTVKRISDCFIVVKIKDNFRVVAKMRLDPNTNKWTFYGGDENKGLRVHNLGKATEIERFMEPTNEGSLKEYLKDS